MRSIWKVTLEITDMQHVRLPRGAVPLAVQFQAKDLCLWAQVETTQPPLRYPVAIVGTGNPADHVKDWLYIGTAQEPLRPLVWHVFMDSLPDMTGTPEEVWGASGGPPRG